MPLDDFFAKKEKKKSKKKQNPQELIEKLTKEVVKLSDQDVEASNDGTKTIVNLGKDDEWEALDEDEKDIEVQSVRIGNLELAPVEESTKPVPKEKSDKEGNEEPEDSKKVWALKVAEPKDEEEEEKPEPPPEPEAPKKYIPIPLRQGYNAGLAVPKPNVSSATDFPTLDAAVSTETTTKNKGAWSSAAQEHDDNAGWSQAGVPQRSARAQDTMPIAVNSHPNVYVPPSLRSSGAVTAPSFPRNDYRSDNRGPRPRDSMPSRFDGPGGGHRFDGFQSRESAVPNMDGWSRGATINTPRTLTTGPPGGSPFAAKNPSPSRFSHANTDYSTDSNSGWTRNVNVKTFRETGREKPDFELVQTNRFAGLDES